MINDNFKKFMFMFSLLALSINIITGIIFGYNYSYKFMIEVILGITVVDIGGMLSLCRVILLNEGFKRAEGNEDNYEPVISDFRIKFHIFVGILFHISTIAILIHFK